MATSNSNNNNSGFGGAFSVANMQSKIATLVSKTMGELDNAPVAKLDSSAAFGTGIVDPSDVTNGETVKYSGQALALYMDPQANNLPWAMKYFMAGVERDAEGRNTTSKTIVVDARQTETGVKCVLSALSMIRRNVIIEATEAYIDEGSKVVINLSAEGVEIIPVVLGTIRTKGGDVANIQKGRITIKVGDRKFNVQHKANVDFTAAQMTGAGWFEFRKIGSLYLHTGNILGEQSVIYERVVEILTKKCDVFLKGLTKYETPKDAGAMMRSPKFDSFKAFYNIRLNRYYTFSQYFLKVFSTLNAGSVEEANNSYNANMKESRTKVVEHGVVSALVKGSVASTNAGEVHLVSELLSQVVVLDSAWVACDQGIEMIKKLGKKAVKVNGDVTVLDLEKVVGSLILIPTDAVTHDVKSRSMGMLKIDPIGITGEGKDAILDAESNEGKQNLKALTLLSNLGQFKFQVAWKVAAYEATK